MIDFIFSVIIWTLALYGLIEIIKNIYYIWTYTNLGTNGINIIVAVKNQEEKIEGFMRSVLFRIFYGKEENIKNLIVADLDSSDRTMDILTKLQSEYEFIKITDWKKCKEIIDNIENN